MRAVMILLGLSLTLAACSRGGTPNLVNLPPGDGPDEFAILPSKPLQTPPDLAALPRPTPGAANLTDPTPQADAVAALGGNRGVLARPSGDGALLGYVARYGVAPDIRPTLAAADLEYRRANDGRLLERLFNVNIYHDAYEPLALDQYRELERFRAAGVPTPAAPPPLVAEE